MVLIVLILISIISTIVDIILIRIGSSVSNIYIYIRYTATNVFLHFFKLASHTNENTQLPLYLKCSAVSHYEKFTNTFNVYSHQKNQSSITFYRIQCNELLNDGNIYNMYDTINKYHSICFLYQYTVEFIKCIY